MLLALGAFLLWQILTRSVAAFLASMDPASALLLRPTEATALLTLAEQELQSLVRRAEATQNGSRVAAELAKDDAQADGDKIAGWSEMALRAIADTLPPKQRQANSAGRPLGQSERAEARSRAEAVLLADPLNARALRILGLLTAVDGDQAKASKFMQAAVKRSLEESMALYWMLQENSKNKDYQKALFYADAFIRTRPQFAEYIAPVIAAMAESGEAQAQATLKAALAQDPPWREEVLAALPKHARDARTPLNLLLSLKTSPAPPTKPELRSYLEFLINRKLFDLAYYTWLQFLPTDELGTLTFLTNGSFEKHPSGLPFDWTFPRGGSGVTVDIAARSDAADQHALVLQFGPGRADFPGVSQLILLPPGAYRLKGKMKGEFSGPRGLRWRLLCANDQRSEIAAGPMFIGLDPRWTDFKLSFVVPDMDCHAQYLSLELAARSASEQLVSGQVWYDELQIVREEDARATP